MTATSTDFALMTYDEARRETLRRYLVPVSSAQGHLDWCKARQPEGGPLFGDADDDSVRVLWSAARTWVGVDAVLRELETAVGGPAIWKALKREFDYWENNNLYANGKGRFHQYDRHNDMPEFANIACHAAAYAGHAQRAHLDGRAGPAYETPKGHIEDMARASIRYWLPAIQNIISRLPAGERQEEADRAQLLLRRFHCDMAESHTLALKIGDERKRWAAGGVGALDVAVVTCAVLIGFARELAGRMECDCNDHVARALRHYTAEAWDTAVKALASLSDERLDVLRVRVWQRDKAGLLVCARTLGGITPAGAARYYPQGAMVPGY